jgi:hypothetical protein
VLEDQPGDGAAAENRYSHGSMGVWIMQFSHAG